MPRHFTDDRQLPEESYWLKYDRARLHSGEAHELRHSWIHNSIDSKTGEGDLRRPPAPFLMATGDAMQCFRHSLDHFLYAAAKHFDADLDDSAASKLYFPFDEPGATKLPVADQVRDAIVQLIRRDERLPESRRLLPALRRVTNIDRHRLVPAILIARITYTDVHPTPTSRPFYSADAFWDFEKLSLPIDDHPPITYYLQGLERVIGDFLDQPRPAPNRDRHLDRTHLQPTPTPEPPRPLHHHRIRKPS